MNLFCVVIDHFCCRQQFSHNFSLTTLMTHARGHMAKLESMTEKSLTREVVDYILHCLSTALNINSDVGFQKLLKYMWPGSQILSLETVLNDSPLKLSTL